MENSASDDTWGLFNGTMSEMTPSDIEYWNQMFFPGTLNGATDPHTLANPTDSIETPQSIQNLAANNQEPSSNPDNELFPTGQPAPQIHTLPHEDLSVIQDIKKELQEVKRELVTVKGQYQTTQSELYTVKSNHTKLLRWSVDMGEAMKTLAKWIAENTGVNIVGRDGLSVEEIVSS